MPVRLCRPSGSRASRSHNDSDDWYDISTLRRCEDDNDSMTVKPIEIRGLALFKAIHILTDSGYQLLLKMYNRSSQDKCKPEQRNPTYTPSRYAENP